LLGNKSNETGYVCSGINIESTPPVNTLIPFNYNWRVLLVLDQQWAKHQCFVYSQVTELPLVTDATILVCAAIGERQQGAGCFRSFHISYARDSRETALDLVHHFLEVARKLYRRVLGVSFIVPFSSQVLGVFFVVP